MIKRGRPVAARNTKGTIASATSCNHAPNIPVNADLPHASSPLAIMTAWTANLSMSVVVSIGLFSSPENVVLYERTNPLWDANREFVILVLSKRL